MTGRPPRVLHAPPRNSTGAALPAIMPTIMTVHITNVKKTSAAVHGMAIVIPISCIMVACCIWNDMRRSR
jgi:hypothetical protein